MEKSKIGMFIATRRREKNITQEQLAEMLGITNKSISKWENGICLPDASLYEPLCAILDITINELFAGQQIKDEDYKRIADENLMGMLKYQVYCMSDKSISFDEFDNALTQMSLITMQLKAFDTREDAVAYLVKETQEDYEACAKAYDFYIALFDKNTTAKKNKMKKKTELWRVIAFILSILFIAIMWAKKDIVEIYTTMPQEQIVPLIFTTVAVSVIKVGLIAGVVLLIK